MACLLKFCNLAADWVPDKTVSLVMRSLFSIPIFVLVALFSTSLGAEPLRFHGSVAGALPVGGHLADEAALGGSARVAIELPFSEQFGVAAEVSGLMLTDGEAPSDAAFSDPEAPTALGGALQARWRPQRRYDGQGGPINGLWTSFGVGIMGTGGVSRPVVDLNLGYDIIVDNGWLQWGPTVGLLHVFQPDDELRPEDADVVLFGLHVAYDRAPRLPLDVDKDGIFDKVDACPEDPEDKDGFEDEDGCPESDNDKDKILDSVDHCPNDAEDLDGFEDEDGCPEADYDKDGIEDADDSCPDEAEDKDDFEDEDGCPEADNDKDGIVDGDDLCPNEPETKNGYADHDGCPDSEHVRVVGDQIKLDDKVHFRTNNPKIRMLSYPLLERLATLLKDNPSYVRVEIQGHTDNRGNEEFNQQLSQRRADAVRDFLIERGVAPSRLEAKGYGSSKPIVEPAGGERAWYMNRRVEIMVTREVREVKRVGGDKEGETIEPNVGGSGSPSPSPADEKGAAE